MASKDDPVRRGYHVYVGKEEEDMTTKTVTLYGIDDSEGLNLEIVYTYATEAKTMYIVKWTDTASFLNYGQRIGKHSIMVSLSPQEALLKYIKRQSNIVNRGLRAAERRAEAGRLLLGIEEAAGMSSPSTEEEEK